MPGNPGISKVGECVPAPPDSAFYLDVAERLEVDLTVVGPEVPLVAGVVDQFQAKDRPILGPTRAAAQLEGSKMYAKRFFERYRIPTAEFAAVESRDDALKAVRRFGFPVVLKADGLAAGKGVIVARNRSEAERGIETLGERLVIEEFLEGDEASFIVLADGRDVVPFAATQDHKAVFDGDKGPNTGGMGAYSDDRILTEEQTRFVLDRMILPTVNATRFTGFLYAGLMLTKDGPKLLEFNVRMGDPEAQPLMHRLNSDLMPTLLAATRGELYGTILEWSSEPSVCVVLASEGYPGAYQTGFPIEGIEEAEGLGATVFHAGTRQGDHGLETAGGRVLGMTTSGVDLASAISRAYAAVDKIRFQGMHYRTDIGRKGLSRYNK
jgi:phosphoribosylamine--glycine ligase